MKKSNFRHNPKDMLSKSFKPAKCKTTLKLAASRMKLMKNKKEVQVKRMKRELAQLLESGQDQTARIRVEHVIREEKMMAAYELIDIYCELIVARLPIIESQKNCPIDLKEAITSVIFASPRCGDIPELVDARKHFTAKYGKEFVTAAIELRPNCGVSRLLVEKLSAKAPDGQTKLKALSEIAEQHNIKWDPESFGQGDVLPPDDLLNGPNTFEKLRVVHAEASPCMDPDFQPPNHPLNFSEQNERSSQGTQNLASRHNSISSSSRPSSTPQAQMSPSVVGSERGEVSQAFQREQSTSSSGHSWNMDFKDAASAAQAAAESAERASMAARAAAELSSRGRISTQQQYLSEVHNSTDHVLIDDRNAKHATSKYTSDYLPKDSVNSFFLDRQPMFHKQTNMIEQDNGERLSERSYQDGHSNEKSYGHIGSSRSKDSFEEDTFAHSIQVPNGNSQKKLSKEEENKVRMSKQKESCKSETEGSYHPQEGFSSENFDYSRKERIRKQPSILSSSSHSSISDTEDRFPKSGFQTLGYDAGKDPSVGIHEEHNSRDIWQSSYDATAPVIFDDSGSDGDDIGFGTGVQHNDESKTYFALPGRNSPSHLSTNAGSESLMFRTGELTQSSISEVPSKKHLFTEFSESSEAPVAASQADNFGPLTFDDSDGPSSDSEMEMPYSGHRATQDPIDLPTKQNQSLGFSDTEMHRTKSWRTENIVDNSEKFGFDESFPAHGRSQPESRNARSKSSFQNSADEADYLGSSKMQMEDEISNDGKELNFKKLTGGFRQKGYTRPLYTKNQLDNTSTSAKRISEDSPTMIQQSADSSVESFPESGKSKGAGTGRSSRVSYNHSDSDSDSSWEELKKQPQSRRQERIVQGPGKDVKLQSSLISSVTYFHSESSDSEDDSAKQVFTGRSHLGSGFSRRTKPSTSSSTPVSNPKASSSSWVPVNSDSATEMNPTTRSYGSKISQAHQSQTRNSDQQGSYEQTSSAKAAPDPSLVSKISLPMENKRSSGVEQLPSSQQKMETSESTNTQKPPSRNFITREESLKKASHVHPKLPDYDTVAARLQALRTNHQ